jgi:hypothetical protein
MLLGLAVSRDDFKDVNLSQNVETLTNLTNSQYINYKMFGNIFVKIFKFLRILYSFYKIWAILKLKYIYSINLGKNIFRKNGNWQLFFGEKHGKLSHTRNLSPKIIYGC